MAILYLACFNNDPVIQSLLGPKCNPVGEEPDTLYLKKINKCCLLYLCVLSRSRQIQIECSLNFGQYFYSLSTTITYTTELLSCYLSSEMCGLRNTVFCFPDTIFVSLALSYRILGHMTWGSDWSHGPIVQTGPREHSHLTIGSQDT